MLGYLPVVGTHFPFQSSGGGGTWRGFAGVVLGEPSGVVWKGAILRSACIRSARLGKWNPRWPVGGGKRLVLGGWYSALGWRLWRKSTGRTVKGAGVLIAMGFSFRFRRPLLLFLIYSFCLVWSVGHCARDSAGETSFSFSFRTFEKTSGAEPEIALYGDAEVVNSTVRITSGRHLSRGRIMYRKILAFGRKPSFSTYFSFSLSKGKGDGLAFLVAPSNDHPELLDEHPFGLSPGVFAVEFDTSMDSEHNDPNGNHVGVDLGTPMSILTGNVSKLNLDLNSGERLQAWIDYDGYSKILEVRLSKSEFSRPSEPAISYPIDLSGLIWKNAMSVGIVSSSGNSTQTDDSTQTSTLYAWSFNLKHAAAYVMHSEPLDPRPFLNPPKEPMIHLRREYLPGVLIGLVFGAACGAMVVILIMFAWTAFVDRRPMVVPAEYPVHPVEYAYEKMVVAGHVNSGNAGKV